MKIKNLITIPLVSFLILIEMVNATPSTTFWTPCTTYIQPFAVPHITFDNYFAGSGAFPSDVGLTIGISPFEKIQAEAGFDLFSPGSYPLQLNAKAGIPEDAFFSYQPGISFGIFGAGFKEDISDYNILHFNIGKTLPYFGSISIGGYKGLNRNLLTDVDGNVNDAGFMVAYYRTLEPFTDRIAIAADWMSGKNAFGGGGVGLYFWFTKKIDLIMGWVWFNDTKINPYSDGVFTIQLDIDFDFKRKLEE